MSPKPRLLDLFCGAGGASVGYHRAGFDVVGVDINPQPRYPFEFQRGDALQVLQEIVRDIEWYGLEYLRFDAIHASPPCQKFSSLTPSRGNPDNHPDLITPSRELLVQTGIPYVIENVPGAPLRDPIMICGTMFDPPLPGLKKHRLFEANWDLVYPQWPCRHKLAAPMYRVYEHYKWYDAQFVKVYGTGGGKAKEHWNEAMGIDWMTKKEMSEAIPPAYTEFIGNQLMAHLKATVAA